MNAYGIIGGANAATAAGAPAASATGKPGAAGSFAGVLVQAIGGTSANGGTAGGIGLPAGLTGLLGLLGGSQSTEAGSAELMNLLQGLSNQLAALDPLTELPEGLQSQLAALLLLVQNLLPANPAVRDALQADGSPSPASQSGTADGKSAATPTGALLIAALQQSLAQLADRLRTGETSSTQAQSLTVPLQQSLEALQQFAAAKPAAGTPGADANASGKRTAAADNQPANAAQAKPEGSNNGLRIEVRNEARPGAFLIRNPIGPYRTAAYADMQPAAVADGPSSAATAGLAEASGPNQSAPVWTLLKSDSALTPAAGSAASNPPVQTPVPIQQFAEQMGKFLVRQFVLTQGQGTAEAKISLHPEHLGQVDIKILIQNGQLTAQFVAENGAARDMLETQMSQLRTALQGQGLQVEKMEVVLQSSPNAAPSFHQHHGHQGSGHNGSGAHGRNARGGYEDSAVFEAELDRTAFLREIGYGASLNVTA